MKPEDKKQFKNAIGILLINNNPIPTIEETKDLLSEMIKDMGGIINMNDECYNCRRIKGCNRVEVLNTGACQETLNKEFINKHCGFTKCKIRPYCMSIGRTCAAICNLNNIKQKKEVDSI